MLHGYLTLIILAGGFLSVPLTLWLIGRYRKRVIQLMGKSRGPAPAAPAVEATRAIPFQFNIIQPGSQPRAVVAFAVRQHCRVVISYIIGMLIFAMGAAICLIRSGEQALSIGRVGIIGLIYLAPLLLVLPLLVGLSRVKWLMSFALLLAVYLTLGTLLSNGNTILALLLLFGGQIVVPTVLVGLLLHPRLRAGGILVLVLTTLGIAGALGLPMPLQDEDFTRSVVDFFFQQGVRDANVIFLIFNLLGLLLGSMVAWWLLQLIKRRYLSKAISDRGLLVDGIVLYFALWLGLLASAQGMEWMLWALACFVAYKLVVSLLLRLWVYAASQQQAPKSLLLLRVFALQGRSDALFRRLSRYWRLQGPVHLIAGPDIVQSTIEPHEFMDFLMEYYYGKAHKGKFEKLLK